MKKKRIFGLAGLAAVVLAAGAGIYYTTSHHGSKGNSDLKVVTSFYPVYEFTKQVVGDEGMSALRRGHSNPAQSR